MSLGKVSENKHLFASLHVQPQCFLTQKQLKFVPIDRTESASLECFPSIFFPRVFHLIFFFPFIYCPKSTRSVQVTAPVLFWYRIFLWWICWLWKLLGLSEATEIFFLLVQIQLQGSRLDPLTSFAASLTAAE